MNSSAAIVRVIEYVRMSTDHQKYSTANQSLANHAYAAAHGMEIVRTYADEGKSGLTFERRDALRRLIGDVQSGTANFSAILVYDVSRWGRFQDTDESGYYEYICKRAGIRIHYCAEQFENDGSVFAAVVKSIKRAMAAEYSRELSVKSYVGQARLFRLGFRVGSSAAYGTRRLLVDQSRVAKFILGPGEYKGLQTDRVVSILGPPGEVEIVRWIFSTFVKKGVSEGKIAKLLNAKGVPSGVSRPWTYARVRWILRNEVYIGNSVWNRTSIKLGRKLVRNPPDTWMRIPCSFAPIINKSEFDVAQKIIRDRRPLTKHEVIEALRRLYLEHGYLDTRLIQANRVPRFTTIRKHFGGLRQLHRLLGSTGPPGSSVGLSDDELLVRLQRLFRKKGRLGEVIINESRDVPHSSIYQRRFGSLARAYELVGYKPPPRSHQGALARTLTLSDDDLLDALQALLRKHGKLTEKLIDRDKDTPTSPTYYRRFGSLTKAYHLIGYVPKTTEWPKMTEWKSALI